ncbi:hypothetical protein LOK49_LG07G01159 [Camellia lanceoleosa]|uniref:Uncharacterized protein n=1 Tax=Camellia lanceoleosa TaxID=1840588 RepID=A0ACC0H3U5_9ERIC|nr:hypothetical protein LOK49_LG07G01159 [Camellia lanceoleosa]
METFVMEDIEVFEFIERLHDRLCVFFRGFIFSLNLDQEPVKVIDGNDSIFGVTVEEIGKAKIMYQEVNKTSFQFEHCWNVLRHQPKWFEQCQKKKPKRIRIDPTSSPSTPEPINLGEDDISPLKRPMGRKAENEWLKKVKNCDSCSPIVDLLNEMKEERKGGTEKKLELLQNLIIFMLQGLKLNN